LEHPIDQRLRRRGGLEGAERYREKAPLLRGNGAQSPSRCGNRSRLIWPRWKGRNLHGGEGKETQLEEGRKFTGESNLFSLGQPAGKLFRHIGG